MRILHVAYVKPHGSLGGMERLVLDLAAAQRERYGCEVAFALNHGRFAEAARARGFACTHLAGRKALAALDAYRLYALVDRTRPSIVHSHHRMTTFLLSLLPPGETPLVHTEHLWRRNRRLFFRPGDYVCCVHPSIARNLSDYYDVSVDKLATIENAVPPIDVDRNRVAALRVSLSGATRRRLVLVPARLEPEKGHRYLLQALAGMMPGQRTALSVIFAGDGSQREALRRQVTRLRLDDVVQLVGYRDDIHDYMAACDLIVLPSLQEGMPLSILEAHQLGKPVIASDLPGTRYTGGRNGAVSLVPPADAAALADSLTSFLCAGSHRATTTVPGPARSHDAMVADYMRVYRNLLKPCGHLDPSRRPAGEG